MLRAFHRQSAEFDDAEDTLPEAAPEPEPAAPGPESLRDGPLLAEWFIAYQLQRELERARRHHRPLSVVVLTPVPSLGTEPDRDALVECAAVAQESARSTDLIGWLQGNRIVLILPETDKDGAAAAVYRISTLMSSRSRGQGQMRWVATARVDGFEFSTGSELLAALNAVVI